MASIERLEATGSRGESVIVICERKEIDPSSLEWPASTILAARRQLSWPI